MSFSPPAQLLASTMVRVPGLPCDAPWFISNKGHSFQAAGYVDGNKTLSRTLSFGRILYFEWQCHGTFSVGELVRMRRRCSRAPGMQGLIKRPQFLDWLSWWSLSSICWLDQGCFEPSSSLIFGQHEVTEKLGILQGP